MIYGEAKVYFDGSHYIAIPHTTRPSTKRVQTPEEEITVYEENETKITDTPTEISESVSVEDIKQASEPLNGEEEPRQAETPIARKTTRKELFEQLYTMTNQKRREERRKIIKEGMRPYFKTDMVDDVIREMWIFLQITYITGLSVEKKSNVHIIIQHYVQYQERDGNGELLAFQLIICCILHKRSNRKMTLIWLWKRCLI